MPSAASQVLFGLPCRHATFQTECKKAPGADSPTPTSSVCLGRLQPGSFRDTKVGKLPSCRAEISADHHPCPVIARYVGFNRFGSDLLPPLRIQAARRGSTGPKTLRSRRAAENKPASICGPSGLFCAKLVGSNTACFIPLDCQ